MSYIGTKIFFGVCLNSYLSYQIMGMASSWLDDRLREERKIILSEIRTSAAVSASK